MDKQKKNHQITENILTLAKKKVKEYLPEIMQKHGIPKRFLAADLKDFEKPFDLDNGGYFFGKCGTGKTHLLASIMKDRILSILPEEIEYIEHIYPHNAKWPIFIGIPSLLLKIRTTFNNTNNTEGAIIEKYSNYSTLMLDDIGTEKPSDWVLQTLYLIIDNRYSEMKETFITSNLSLDDLSRHLSDRIASRIAGMCKVIRLNGEDRRIKK